MTTPHPAAEPGTDSIRLTLGNRSHVIDWLRGHGLDAEPPVDPGSDAALIQLPDRTAVVILGETCTVIGDTIAVGRNIDNPRDLLPVGGDHNDDDRQDEDQDEDQDEASAVRPVLITADQVDQINALNARVSDQIRASVQVFVDGFVQARRNLTNSLGEAARHLAPTTPAATNPPAPRPPAPPATLAAPTPPDLPPGVRMIEPPQVWDRLPGEAAVALCGLIPGVEAWHDEVAELVAAAYTAIVDAEAHPLAILCPRRRDFLALPDGTVTVGGEPWTPAHQTAQVDWEWDHIRQGVALFWLPDTSTAFGPTTFLELGLAHASSTPMAVGADPWFVRRDVVEHATRRMGLPLHATKQDVAVGAVELLIDHITDPEG